MKLKSGIRFIYVGELIRTPFSPDHRGIRQGLEWLKADGVIQEFKIVDPILYPERVVSECNNFNADIIVHGNTDSLDHDWPQHIKCGLQCFFMGDVQPLKSDYNRWDIWIKNGAGYFDALFISNRDQLSMWSEDFKAPAFFWPHGCFVPERLEKGEQQHDLLFVGSMTSWGNYQARYDLVNSINNAIKIDFLTSDSVEGRNAIWQRMPKLYHTANFVLDISHFWDIDSYASGRYWYSGGLGACTLTKEFPGCEDFYAGETEKLYFDTLEEAKELYDFYKLKPAFVEKIKYRAYERNKRDHNYALRFKQMFNLVGIDL